MPERLTIDIDKVGYDTDFEGTDACCIRSLNGEEPTPEGVAVICNTCGDAWVSQIREDGEAVWFRTYAGKYSEEYLTKIRSAAARERRVKRAIVLTLVAVVAVLTGWNFIDYSDEVFSLQKALFNTGAVILVSAVGSVFLFGSLFRKFSRNNKKLKYQLA